MHGMLIFNWPGLTVLFSVMKTWHLNLLNMLITSKITSHKREVSNLQMNAYQATWQLVSQRNQRWNVVEIIQQGILYNVLVDLR